MFGEQSILLGWSENLDFLIIALMPMQIVAQTFGLDDTGVTYCLGRWLCPLPRYS